MQKTNVILLRDVRPVGSLNLVEKSFGLADWHLADADNAIVFN